MQVKNLKILTAAIALLFSISGYSQLNVTPNGNANALLSAIIGQGVTVSNVTINCPNGAAGTFTGGNGTNLGLSSGMMLTTGSATGNCRSKRQ